MRAQALARHVITAIEKKAKNFHNCKEEIIFKSKISSEIIPRNGQILV